MQKYLVTGCAGFIASRVSELLLDQGHYVFGIDNLNDAYDIRMKEYRLNKIKKYDNFVFEKMDISNKEQILKATRSLPGAWKVCPIKPDEIRVNVYAHIRRSGSQGFFSNCMHQETRPFWAQLGFGLTPSNPNSSLVEEFIHHGDA